MCAVRVLLVRSIIIITHTCIYVYSISVARAASLLKSKIVSSPRRHRHSKDIYIFILFPLAKLISCLSLCRIPKATTRPAMRGCCSFPSRSLAPRSCPRSRPPRGAFRAEADTSWLRPVQNCPARCRRFRALRRDDDVANVAIVGRFIRRGSKDQRGATRDERAKEAFEASEKKKQLKEKTKKMYEKRFERFELAVKT